MRKLAGLALFLLLLGGFFLLRPSFLGGGTSYVIVYGISMQPTLFQGDLVLAQRGSSYGVGDVVAYKSPEKGGLIIHRIIGQEGDSFILQGDNNPEEDPWAIAPDLVVGKGQLFVPRVGALLALLRNPGGVVFGVSTLFLYAYAIGWLLGPEPGSRERRRKMRMRIARRREGVAWLSW